MNRIVVLLMLALCVALPVQARVPVEQAKIEYLISAVAELKDAVFIRNGVEYDAPRAAEHLRTKLAYAGDKIETATDFIDQCATASWFTRQRYTIRFRDGHVLESAVFLRARLTAYESAMPPHN